MVHVSFYVFFIFSSFQCTLAQSYDYLKSCSEDHDKVEICFKDDLSYKSPFPAILNTDLHLMEIIEINENKNSISIQMDLWTNWTDPGLSLTNNSTV